MLGAELLTFYIKKYIFLVEKSIFWIINQHLHRSSTISIKKKKNQPAVGKFQQVKKNQCLFLFSPGNCPVFYES